MEEGGFPWCWHCVWLGAPCREFLPLQTYMSSDSIVTARSLLLSTQPGMSQAESREQKRPGRRCSQNHAEVAWQSRANFRSRQCEPSPIMKASALLVAVVSSVMHISFFLKLYLKCTLHSCHCTAKWCITLLFGYIQCHPVQCRKITHMQYFSTVQHTANHISVVV